MNQDKLFEDLSSRIGASAALEQINTATLFAIRSLLIEKGIFTEEELEESKEKQFKKLFDVIMRQSIPSPLSRTTFEEDN